MLNKQQPKEIWQMSRKRFVESGQFRCLRYRAKVIKPSEVDRIFSEKLKSNKSENLCTLALRCHIFQNDQRHREMIVKSLEKGIICPDWMAKLRE